MTQHIGDDAELYALGALDATETAAVERHIATCAECATRVVDAQNVAASLASALPGVRPSASLDRRIRDVASPGAQTRTRFSSLWQYAIAAVFALAFLGAGFQAFRLHGQLADEDFALATVVHSHFNHVSMSPISGSQVAAKVLYARDGSWVYVIADRPGGELHVMSVGAAGGTDLGALHSIGQTASLLIRPAARIQSLVLQRDGVPVAAATLK
jgi:anti-sigma factor RsiW